MPVSEELAAQKEIVKNMLAKYQAAVASVNEVNDPEYTSFVARRLVEMAGDVVMSFLLITDATRYASESMTKSAKVYVNFVQAEVEKHASFIASFNPADVALYKA